MSGRVVTVVQARAGSTRLPGKVLLPLGRGCVLDVMLTRVKAARLVGEIVVATTTNSEDDEIERVAARNDVHCYRGHPTDLLDRHVRAASVHRASHVVKIPSDCPLIDPRVIDEVLEHYLARWPDVDFVSNLHPPTHPDGNDVEVIAFDVLAEAWLESKQPIEREHTTTFVWAKPGRYRVSNVLWNDGRNCSQTHRLVLDYAEDYDVLAAVYGALSTTNALFSVENAVEFLDANPWVRDHNRVHHGIQWYHRQADEFRNLDQYAS